MLHLTSSTDLSPSSILDRCASRDTIAKADRIASNPSATILPPHAVAVTIESDDSGRWGDVFSAHMTERTACALRTALREASLTANIPPVLQYLIGELGRAIAATYDDNDSSEIPLVTNAPSRPEPTPAIESAIMLKENK